MIKPKDYTPYALKKYPEKDLRKEYSRLRAIVQKRLTRIIAAGLDRTGAYKSRLASLPKLREIQTQPSLRSNLVELYRFVQNRTTVTQIREDRIKRLESLQRYGLNWINEENLDRFDDYMGYMREQGYIENYGSEEVVEYYEKMRSREEVIEELAGGFEEWQSRNWKENKSFT